jgi:hypothetical protein
MEKNPLLELFRVKVTLLMEQYVARTKVFVTENRLMGMPTAGLKRLREKELSKWAFDKNVLEKQIKKEAAGLINKVFMTAYLDELRPKAEGK